MGPDPPHQGWEKTGIARGRGGNGRALPSVVMEWEADHTLISLHPRLKTRTLGVSRGRRKISESVLRGWLNTHGGGFNPG